MHSGNGTEKYFDDIRLSRSTSGEALLGGTLLLQPNESTRQCPEQESNETLLSFQGHAPLLNMESTITSFSLGTDSGTSLQTNSNDVSGNILIGDSVLSKVESARNNIFLGSNSGAKCTSESASFKDNIGIGAYALNGSEDVIAGVSNISIGYQSMRDAGGNLTGNVAIGYSAGYRLQSSYNTCIGVYAGGRLITGGSNVAIGYYASNSYSYSAAISHTIAIGYSSYPRYDYTMQLGGTSLDYVYIYGDLIAYYTSDIRLKENIVTIENALDKVAKIRGITFK